MRADSHWTYILKIENGRRNPGIDVLRRISAGLGLPLSALIGQRRRLRDQQGT